MTARQFYQAYISDDNFSPLSAHLISEIKRLNPKSVFDFGCGSGKHCNALLKEGIDAFGMDISMMNVVRANAKYDLPFVALGSENALPYLGSFDIVTTCSVLDHIEDIHKIICEFKRIATIGIVLAETNDVPGEFYYPHDYESYGFKKTHFEWTSDGDGARYNIWIWRRGQSETLQHNDDLCVGR